MNKFLGLLVGLALLSGCSTMTPARYSISADNNQALRQFEGSRVRLASLTPPQSYSANCRLMGPIKAADGKSIPEFVQAAFNDEFKLANIYGVDGVSLEGSLDKIEFSSVAGLTSGWWELGITLRSQNGRSLQKFSRTEFKSGFDAITACNQTAQALGGAVQDLINATVTDPAFAALLLPGTSTEP